MSILRRHYEIQHSKQKFECGSCKTEYYLQTLSDTVKENDFNDYLAREKATIPFHGIVVVECQNLVILILRLKVIILSSCLGIVRAKAISFSSLFRSLMVTPLQHGLRSFPPTVYRFKSR
jgi:hypothetical protein